MQTINPATGEILENFNFHNDKEIEIILAKAASGFRMWRNIPIEARVNCLVQFAKVLRHNKANLARTLTREMGKILSESEAEVEKCAREAEWYAEHGAKMLADEHAPVTEAKTYVSFLPLGPILAIMPWNFPIWQVTRFAIPTILAGNVVVLKHAPNVLRTALEIERLLLESGFPEGVLQNILIPVEKIEAIIADKRIMGASLTGSPRAGASLSALAGKYLKKSVLELGGSDPFIVLPDADLDAAVKAAITSRYMNAGQVCIAAKRFILTAPIADDFMEKFVTAVSTLRVGDPMIADIQMGPLARADLRDNLDTQVKKSVALGAKLLCGGGMITGRGFYYQPTVLASVMPRMPAFDEEIFGPVAALMLVQDEASAIALANRSVYGLNSSIWTQDTARAAILARDIEAGAVFINAVPSSDPRVPIGGTKKSGFGRELSHFGMREFMNIQTVWMKA